MTTLSGDSLFKSCDRVRTFEEAKQPVLTALLPVKGLRRDASGNLTADAIKTVMEGLKSLGSDAETVDGRDAVVQEARYSLCRIYAQYSFLTESLLTSAARAEILDDSIIRMALEKNQQMMDILSILRHVLSLKSYEASESPQPRGELLREGFQDSLPSIGSTLAAHKEALRQRNLHALRQRSLEDVTEKNRYADRQLGIYAFMNIVAAGLLFYIMSL